jgi:hypothetical protein
MDSEETQTHRSDAEFAEIRRENMWGKDSGKVFTSRPYLFQFCLLSFPAIFFLACAPLRFSASLR